MVEHRDPEFVEVPVEEPAGEPFLFPENALHSAQVEAATLLNWYEDQQRAIYPVALLSNDEKPQALAANPFVEWVDRGVIRRGRQDENPFFAR